MELRSKDNYVTFRPDHPNSPVSVPGSRSRLLSFVTFVFRVLSTCQFFLRLLHLVLQVFPDRWRWGHVAMATEVSDRQRGPTETDCVPDGCGHLVQSVGSEGVASVGILQQIHNSLWKTWNHLQKWNHIHPIHSSAVKRAEPGS